MNEKQIKYSNKKVFKALMQTHLKLFLFVMLIMAVPATIFAVTNGDDSKESISVVAGTSMAGMLAIGNIEGVSDNEVAGEALSYKIWLIHYSQIDDSKGFPKPSVAREVGAVPLKPGEKPHYFMAHAIPDYQATGEKGDLTISGTNTFTIIMGGLRVPLLNFIEEFAGGKFLVFFQECESDDKYILGSPCKPMILKSYDAGNDKDKRAVTFVFENRSTRLYYKYTGDLSGNAPQLHTTDATALAVAPGVSAYRIPDGSSATYAIATVSGLSANDENRYITLFGEGTTKSATIADSTNFVLKNGATWTAKAGSQLTLKVHDTSTLIEVSRIQVV